MPFAENNGCKIHYQIKQGKTPLLLVAGLGADVTFWSPPFIRRLNKNFKLILTDNRGAGNSDKPSDKYTIKQMAEDILNVLNHAGLEKINIIGISMGGFISQEFAINYSQRVLKCVLIATHFGGEKRIAPDFNYTAKLLPSLQLSEEENARRALSVLYSENFLKQRGKSLMKFYKQTKKQNKMPVHALLNQFDAAKEFECESRLDNMLCPTLVLQGTKDKIIKPGNAALLKQRISNCRVVMFEGAGHSLPAERPNECADEIERFILK